MEEWACAYKPIQHLREEGERRFFRVDDEMRLNEFLQHFIGIPPGQPVCGIVTHLEGTADVPKRFDSQVVKFLFLQSAPDQTDFHAQADAKAACHEHAWKFLVYLHRDVDRLARTDRTHPLAHLDLHNVQYDMLGPITSANWFCQILTLTAPQYAPSCFSEADYIE
jgi:hypothetical protein